MENTIVLKGPVEYIKEAIKIYFKKENMIFFVKVMSFSTIFSSIATYINSYFTSSNMYVQRYDDVNLSILISIFTIISVVVTLWLQSSAFFSVLNMEKSVKDVVKMSIYKLLPFFGISFVLGLINIFGLLLLVVPAVIFGLWFSFTLYLYFEKGVRLTEALKTSKALVKGKMMKVLGRFVVFGLFSMLVSVLFTFIPFAGSVVLGLLSPLLILPSYLLYKDLSVNLN